MKKIFSQCQVSNEPTEGMNKKHQRIRKTQNLLIYSTQSQISLIHAACLFEIYLKLTITIYEKLPKKKNYIYN